MQHPAKTTVKQLRNTIAASLLAALLATIPAASRAAGSPPPVLPDSYQLSLLIYTTLAALDQANTTGNYTVLRQLAAPAFQTLNTPDALASTFAKYRQKRVVLTPVMLYQPTLSEPPSIGADGVLRLKGYFATRPLRIGFELGYQPVGGTWKLISMSILPAQA